MKVLLVHLVCVYFFSGVYKLLSPAWQTGYMMYFVNHDLAWSLLPNVTRGLPVVFDRLATWVTLAWELGFPVLIAFRRTRAATLWLGVVTIGILGASDSVTMAVRHTTVQLTTPDHMRGRAFSFMSLSAQTANNLGTIWVGFWSAAIGPSNTMLLGGIISIVATLIIWRLWPPIRAYRYPPDEPVTVEA